MERTNGSGQVGVRGVFKPGFNDLDLNGDFNVRIFLSFEYSFFFR